MCVGQEYFHSASTYARDGGYYFTCLGNETNLLHCQHTLNTSTGCVRGGVACSKQVPFTSACICTFILTYSDCCY